MEHVVPAARLLLCYTFRMTTENPWDKLGTYFNTNQDPADIESNAADNVYIAWPVILDEVRKHFTSISDGGYRALDFACGTGQFSKELINLGFDTIGVDPSKSMIEVAQQIYPEPKFIHGDGRIVASLGSFSFISCLMGFQFIEDAPRTFARLATALGPNGLLSVAVFNPAYAQNATLAHKEFTGFEHVDEPAAGYLELLDGDKIATYIRPASYYNQIADQNDLTLITESYPPFTQEFLDRFPHPVPTKDPEYLILNYTKS
jgi:SAM-dependent methyltransferase